MFYSNHTCHGIVRWSTMSLHRLSVLQLTEQTVNLTSVSEITMASVQEKATICSNSPFLRDYTIREFPLWLFQQRKKVSAIEVAHLREDYEKLLEAYFLQR